MGVATHLAYKEFQIDNLTWQAITLPIACSQVSLWNVSGGYGGLGSALVDLCTDTTDVTTKKPLPNGSTEVVSSSLRQRIPTAKLRFQAGDVLCYAKSAGATTMLILTCLE